VVDIAEDGGEDGFALGGAFDLLEVLFEAGDGAFHHLCGLEDEGEDELPGAKLVADLLHGGEEDIVEDPDPGGVQFRIGGRWGDQGRGPAGALGDRGVDQLLDPLATSVQDLPVDGFVGLQRGGRVGGRRLFRLVRLEEGDEALEGVGAPVEDQVVGELALLGGDLRVGGDVRGVDDRQVEPRLDGVVHEDGVQYRAGVLGQPEGDVGDAEHGEDAGEFGLDESYTLDGLEGG